MTSTIIQVLFFAEVLMFISVIFMHLSKKNSSVVSLYVAQSLIISALLFNSSIVESSLMLMIVAIIVFVAKVIVAPYFLYRLINKNQLKFSVSTYLNGPLTLIILAGITAFTYSHFFRPLTVLTPQNANSLLLAMAMMLSAVFLIINRKGALSQIVGILSLENAIVSFANLAGLEIVPVLQLGIIFDIIVWVVIATVFASMIYKQFGTLDVTVMGNLKEE